LKGYEKKTQSTKGMSCFEGKEIKIKGVADPLEGIRNSKREAARSDVWAKQLRITHS